MSRGPPTNEKPGKHPFFIKKHPTQVQSKRNEKHEKGGLQVLKLAKAQRLTRLKRYKVPVIPFLSLSSGGRSRRRKGKKGRLGELWVAGGTKRTPRWLPKGGSVMTVPGKELEDEAAGRRTRDEGVGVRILRLDGLAAHPLPLPQPSYASRPRRRP